jgi:hypothetical protein
MGDASEMALAAHLLRMNRAVETVLAARLAPSCDVGVKELAARLAPSCDAAVKALAARLIPSCDGEAKALVAVAASLVPNLDAATTESRQMEDRATRSRLAWGVGVTRPARG